MGRVESYCFALVLLCCLPIGPSSYAGTHIDQRNVHKRQLATRQLSEKSNLECVRAISNSMVDNYGHLKMQWNLESMSQENVCTLAGVDCSTSTGLLAVLNLRKMGLAGEFPSGALSKCRSLTTIILSHNNFNGSLPLDLCLQMPYLVELDLSWNLFSGDVKLLNCSFLTQLYLHGNQFSGEIVLSNCTSLTTLSLFHNSFIGKLPSNLCTSLPLLAQLDLSHNQFSEQIVLSNCTALVQLDLSHNNFSGEIPAALSDSLFLQKLYLQNNLLSGAIPQGLGLLPNLHDLDLAYNALFGPIPSSLLENPRLSHLDLKSNKRLCGPPELMPDSMYDDWECLKSVKSSIFDMDNRLASWDLSCMFPGNICSFEGVDCWSSGLVSALTLEQSSLRGSFPLGLSKCKWIETLSLAQNRFSGSLPADLWDHMTSLRVLDLSYNEFVGSVPTEIADCKALTTLRLQNNLFSGAIPSALGLLPSLNTLDISSNALSGSIPSSLLNRSLSAASFANNSDLCGPPLLRQCASKNKQSPFLVLKIAGGTLFLLVFLAIVLILCRLQKQVCRSSREGPTARVELFDKHLRVTWDDLRRATSGFNQANLIGRGASSKVYKGTLLDGRMVAIKVLMGEQRTEHDMELNTREQFFTELEVLGKLRHRNLVRILSYCYNLDTMAIILDFMPLGSLNALLHGSIKSHQRNHIRRLNMDWKMWLGILMDVAEGLEYLHHEYDSKHCIIHGDLKPCNVLLDKDMKACIADFGVARMVQNINTCPIATPSRQIVYGERWCSYGYTAPEVIQQGVVSRKADIYSFGVTMLEVITGERPNSWKLEEGQTLAEWVGKAVAKGEPQSVVAIWLKESTWKESSEDITAVLKLGCACAWQVPASRPDIHQVLTFLGKLVVKHIQRYDFVIQV